MPSESDLRIFLARSRNAPKGPKEIDILPNLNLSGKKLGGANQYQLIGGWWNKVDISGCTGYVVISGFVNRLVMNGAQGIIVRLNGTFVRVKARNLGRGNLGQQCLIGLNGCFYDIELCGTAMKDITFTSATYQLGGVIPSWARAGEINHAEEWLDPLAIRFITAEEPERWRKEIERVWSDIRRTPDPH